MDGASGHARRLASNFLDDVDSLQRESRARDRRAMSHFGAGGLRSSSLANQTSTEWTHRRRSLSHSYNGASRGPVSSHYRYGPHRVIAQQTPVVMMVGGKSHHQQPSVVQTERDQYWYDQIRSNPYAQLPTSILRAHSPPRKHLLTEGARDLFSYRYYNPLRRALSMADLYDYDEEPVSRVYHSTVSRRTPMRSRLSSVPPAVTRTYRPSYYTSDVDVSPAPVSKSYYTTRRYVSEVPSYTYTPLTSRPVETYRPHVSSYYSPAPVTRSYVYNYPSVATGRHYYPGTYATSYSNLLPEVQYERRRVEGDAWLSPWTTQQTGRASTIVRPLYGYRYESGPQFSRGSYRVKVSTSG